MTRDQLAAALNGKEYPLYLSAPKLFEEAKSGNLLIVCGASDDLIAFEGLFSDEVGAYEGGYALLDAGGILPERNSIEDDEALERYFKRKKTAAKIKALWCAEPDIAWSFETKLPHSTFDVKEYGDVYCRGLVIALSDLPEVSA